MHVNQKQQLKDEVDKMKQFFYETTFEATETLQNGNERRAKHKILSPMFRNNKPITEDEIMERGEEELHENGYYNIEYLGTKKVALMILD